MRALSVVCLLALAACAGPAAVAPPPPPAPVPAPQAAARPAPPRPPARPAPPRPPEPTLWRAASDGVTACADPAALRLLREADATDAAQLRRLAATRAAGGCVTIFRGQSWRLVEPGAETLRLSPVDGGAGPLHFWRDEVTEDRGA